MRIGITGGIGSGKSTVTALLRERGYTVIDADQVARDLTAGHTPVVAELAQALGPAILQADGTLDRAKTAQVVFADPEKRAILEDIVTKQVIQACRDALDAAEAETDRHLVFLDAPLLLETGIRDQVENVWSVICPQDLRIQRVLARDHTTREAVEARMAAQLSDQERIARSDEVIENGDGMEALQKQVEGLLEKYAGL